MSAEADAIYGERSPDRVNSRNGTRKRGFDTRVGTMELAIPKLRRGSYFPDWLLTPRRRAEQALVAVVAECSVKGVSTRRVDGLVKTLGIEGISKSQVSELAKSLDEAVTAFPNASPRRRPLHLRLDRCPDPEVPRRRADRQRRGAVRQRGQRRRAPRDPGARADHRGIRCRLAGVLARSGRTGALWRRAGDLGCARGPYRCDRGDSASAAWQRCRTHFMRDLLTRVPKAAQAFAATLVRSIFAQPDAASVHAQHARVVEQLQAKFPDAAPMLDEAGPKILAFASFPKEHWRRIWFDNPQERLNREIRRRTDVAGLPQP